MLGNPRFNYSKDVNEGIKDSQFDVFSLTILGRNTKFYFDGTQVIFLNYVPFKVLFSNEQFIVVDERGVNYTFGLVLETSGSFSDGFLYGNTDPFLVGAKTWYLTKITTAAGVEAIFNYLPDVQYEINTSQFTYSIGAKAEGSDCISTNNFQATGSSSNLTVGQYLLSNIQWKAKQVFFETILRNDLTSSNGTHAKALSKIRVIDESGNVVKQVGFEYDYMNNNDRLQLLNVSILDKTTTEKEQVFAFEYYGGGSPVPIPSLKTPNGSNAPNHSVDHWGYFNGRANASKVPKANYATVVPTTGSSFGDANRASDGAASKLGMLKRIHYPTKGYTEIEYEPNMVNFANQAEVPFFMKSQNAQLYTHLHRFNTNCTTGSIAIQIPFAESIAGVKMTWRTQTDSPDDVSKVMFIKNNSPTPILDKFSQALSEGEMIIDIQSGGYWIYLQPGCITQNSGAVTAKADWVLEQPDNNPTGGIDLEVGGIRVSKILDVVAEGSNPVERRTGNVLQEEIYKSVPPSSFELIRQATKTYVEPPFYPITTNGYKIGKKLSCPSGTTSQQDASVFYSAGLVPVFSDRFGIATETEADYSGNSQLSTNKSYSYNDDWLLKSAITQNSNNQAVEQSYYYANDFSNTAHPSIEPLKTKNRVGVPLKTIKTVAGKTVDGTLTEIDAAGNPTELYRYQSVQAAHVHNPNQFLSTDFYRLESRKYNSKGNLVEVRPKGEPTSAFLWAYQYTHPVAELTNATATDLENNVAGGAEAAAGRWQDADVANLGNTLRNNLPAAHVASGVWESGVGIKSLSAPNGLSTYYEYDQLNRLARVKDPAGYELNRYFYHYANKPTPTGLGIGTLPTDQNYEVTATARTAQSALDFNPVNTTVGINYKDGLGRVYQDVAYRASPYGQDLTHLYTHNEFSQIRAKTLPLESAKNTGEPISYPNIEFHNGQYREHPWEERFIEPSPLGRPHKHQGPGNKWLQNNIFTTTVYLHNAANEVPNFGVGANAINHNGFYDAATLNVVQTTSEQGNITKSYTDKLGRMVQQSVQENATQYLHTAYVYDDFDRLVYVVPPLLYIQLNGGSMAESSPTFQALAFGYRYDFRGRLVEKQTPGAGWTYTVFDQADHPVLEQNSHQRTQNAWRFIKYDVLGRTIMEGLLTNASARSSLQAQFDAHNVYFETRNATAPLYYTLTNSFPFSVSENTVRLVTYYDDYANWLPADMAFDAPNAYHALQPNAKGAATGGKSRHTENQNWLTTAQYYNYQGRSIQGFVHNVYGQTERTDMEYNFTGQVLKMRQQFAPPSGVGVVRRAGLLTEYEYDHVGRKTACFQTLNGGIREKIAMYYYDFLGRLRTKTIMPDKNYRYRITSTRVITRPPGPDVVNVRDFALESVCLLPGVSIDAIEVNTYTAQIGQKPDDDVINGLQIIDYHWHIRGGILGVNLGGDTGLLPFKFRATLFAYKLDYEPTVAGGVGLYDGNISKQTWSTSRGAVMEETVQRSYT